MDLDPQSEKIPQPEVSSVSPSQAVVAVFDSRDQAELAVDALQQAGFTSDHIGFAIRGDDAVQGGMITDAEGTKDVKGAGAGALAGGLIGGLIAAGIAAIPGFGPVLVGGILASFFGGAIAGTAVGGMLGAMTGLGVSESEAHFYQTHFAEGKAIIAVRAESRAADAAEILRKFGGQHIHGEPTSPVQTGGLFSTP